MKTLNSILLLFLLLIQTLQAKDITMSFGGKIPPYTFPETNSGIELEVIGAALAFKGHTLKPKYFALKEVPIAFKKGLVDAAMTDLGEDLEPYNGYYGNPAVLYNNVFITLKEQELSIKKPEDMADLVVTSFQGAVNRYPKWLNAVKAKYNYFEQNNQQLQVLVLHKKRVDVILSDINIYKYNVSQLQKQKKFIPKAVKIHRFTDVNPMNYRPIFRDKQIRDDFNEGLVHIKKSGEYEKIYSKYLK